MINALPSLRMVGGYYCYTIATACQVFSLTTRGCHHRSPSIGFVQNKCQMHMRGLNPKYNQHYK